MNKISIIIATILLGLTNLSFATSTEDKKQMEFCKSERQRLGLHWEEKKVNPSLIETKLLNDGRLQLVVHHEVLRDVTVKQVSWWFRHMAAAIPSGITSCKPYIMLDDDHVSIDGVDTDDEGLLVKGSRIKFHEELKNGSNEYSVEEEFLIAEMKEGSLEFVKDRLMGIPLGTPLAKIRRTYKQVEGGVQIVTVFTAGIEPNHFPGVVKRLNNFLIAKLFPPARQEAWKQHTVEEIGAIESLLPWLMLNWNKVTN